METEARVFEDSERLHRWMWEHMTVRQQKFLVFMVLRWWSREDGIRPDRRQESQVCDALRDRGLIAYRPDGEQVPTDQGFLVVEQAVRFGHTCSEFLS